MFSIVGVSPLVDKCAGLISKHAYLAYGRLSDMDRRSIDPDDLIQQGVMAAVQAQGIYNPAFSKFSTYLTPRLAWTFSDVLDKFGQAKRALPGRVIELDSPETDSRMIESAVTEVPKDCDFEQAQVFVRFCERVRPDALVILLRGILCGNPVPLFKKYYGAIRHIRYLVKKHGLRYVDMLTLTKNERAREIALTMLANSSILKVGQVMSVKILECVSCGGHFGLEAVRTGRYIPETMTCRVCYGRMREADSAISCFGKVKTDTHEGYSESDVECRIHCRDRNICRQIITKGTNMGNDALKEAEKELAGFAEPSKESAKAKPAKAVKASKPKPKPKPKAEAKTETKPKAMGHKHKKPAKKAAAKSGKVPVVRLRKPDEEAPPKEIGPYWPFRIGSMMQKVFSLAYKGIPGKKLKAIVERPFEKTCKCVPCKTKEGICKHNGCSWRIMLTMLRTEHNDGKHNGERKTHTWKLSDEDGIIKVYDVKFVGKVAKSKAAAAAKSKAA